MTPVKFKTNPTLLRDVMMPRGMRYLFDDFFGSEETNSSNSFFKPGVDIVENEKSFDLHLSIPGMKKEEIKIEMKGDDLVISGVRTAKRTEDNGKVHLSEINYGSFTRSFYLPENIDRENILANYEDGILNVQLPKGESAKAKTISIQ
ncbi:MAG: Hsp20/alpha crystallin family protein [Bacteroidia bacterium]|jgi:HSP20 family protein|nr:Hsp20/alpha crystallin family protein [Bacteroidia bacterium]